MFNSPVAEEGVNNLQVSMSSNIVPNRWVCLIPYFVIM
jgi:hypothetical protein